jgi:PIN domain nuclease of toxin-antitoxin system
VRYLLDTHVFLWWIAGDDRLSDRARTIIADGQNVLYLSAASCWEIAIKTRLGRLTLSGDAQEFIPEHMARNSIEGLPVQVAHALRVASLPDHHRDPFDRLLVAQSEMEALPLLTSDRQFQPYKVPLVW